uniref:Uncharacterized protein n=1 Tax=Oryza punctata TaxID=4537 RepID=A0A0E0LDJ3_ORYPU
MVARDRQRQLSFHGRQHLSAPRLLSLTVGPWEGLTVVGVRWYPRGSGGQAQRPRLHRIQREGRQRRPGVPSPPQIQREGMRLWIQSDAGFPSRTESFATIMACPT